MINVDHEEGQFKGLSHYGSGPQGHDYGGDRQHNGDEGRSDRPEHERQDHQRHGDPDALTHRQVLLDNLQDFRFHRGLTCDEYLEGAVLAGLFDYLYDLIDLLLGAFRYHQGHEGRTAVPGDQRLVAGQVVVRPTGNHLIAQGRKIAV